MIGRRIIASKDVALAEVSEILSKVSEEELGFEQSKTLEYTKKFSKLSREDSDELIKELMENSKISRTRAVKLVDLMPISADSVKALFLKETFSLSDEEITWILNTIKKFSKDTTKEEHKEAKGSKSKEKEKETKESKKG